MKESLLPTGEKIETQRLRRDFMWLEVTPTNATEHPFKFLAPKSFRAVPVSESEKIDTTSLTTLLSLQDSASSAGIIVQKQKLPREIAATHWLRLSADQAGRRIEILDTVSDRFADAKVSFTIEGKLYSSRLAVQIAGGDAFLLFCFAPQATYESLADTFGMFIATWELLSPPKQPSVEPWPEHTLDAFRFRIPASWKIAPAKVPARKGVEAVVFSNLDDDGQPNGFIRIATVQDSRGNSLLGGLEEAFDFWTALNLPHRQLVSQNTPETAVSWAKERSLKILKLDGPAAPPGGFEGRLLALGLDDRWLTISLLTPPEGDTARFHVWAINQRAFKIIAESLSKLQ